MDKEQALEIGAAYYSDFQWEATEQLRNGGWVLRPVNETYVDETGEWQIRTIGLPGVYVSPDGKPEMIYSVPTLWPQAFKDHIALMDDEEEDYEDEADGGWL